MNSLRTRLSRLAQPGRVRLLTELVRANFKRTDQDTILGVLWSLLMPVFFTLVMFLLFRNRFSGGGPGYAVFILIGVSAVGFVVQAVAAIMVSLQIGREIVLNTLVPREMLMIAALLNASIKYGIELSAAIVFATLLASPWWPGFLLLPILLLSFLLMVLGIGMLLALASAMTRDVQYLWSLVSRVLLFATPVFYPLNTVSEAAATAVYYLNPITPFLVSLRWILLGNGTEPFLPAFLQSIACGAILFTVAYSLFLKLESAAVERA